MKRNPLAKKSELVVQMSGEDTLIYNLKTNQALCLNETSAAVWNLCNGRRSVSEISIEMSKRMNGLISEDFVWLALEQLEGDGLLAYEFESSKKFTGLSRREVIKKVGFTAMVALPMITMVVAPAPSLAQSACTAPQGMCVNPGTCCSATCSVSTCCVPLAQPCTAPMDCCNNPQTCTGGVCV